MPPKRGPRLVDLIVLVAGAAVSLGWLSLHLRVDGYPVHSATRIQTVFHDLTVSTSFLAPFTWITAALALFRVRRRRWSSHVAILTGVSVIAASVSALLFLAFWTPPDQSDPVEILLGSLSYHSRLEVGPSLTAFLLTAALAGRLRRPRDWLEWVGAGLGLCWLLLWASWYFIRTA